MNQKALVKKTLSNEKKSHALSITADLAKRIQT